MVDGYDKDKRYVNNYRYEDDKAYYSKNVRDNTLNKKAKQKVKKNNSSQYGVFITLTIGAGIVICLIAFVMVFSAMTSKPEPKIPSENTGLVSDNKVSEIDDIDDIIEVVAIIKEINGNKFKIFNIDDDINYTINVSGTTILKDKYGSNMSAPEFKEGDIIQTEFNSQTQNAQYVKISSEVWEHKNITNVIVDSENKTISFGNQKYNFTEQVVLLNASNFNSITEIAPSDTISVKGIRQKVWTVTLEKSHGNILITNKDKIKDGVLEVNTNIYMQLSEAEKIELTEGSHRIVVKGSNIEPYVKEIKISAHDEITIDLSHVQIKTGVLILKLAEKDYNVYVDNKLIKDPSEPLVLDYNTYNIRVEKEGYETYERNITINKASSQLNVELLEKTTPVSNVGSLTIDTSPSGINADVYIDNAYIGVAPVTAQVELGDHRILIRKDGYSDISVPVTVGETPQNLTIKMYEISSPNDSPSIESSPNENTTDNVLGTEDAIINEDLISEEDDVSDEDDAVSDDVVSDDMPL